MRFFGPFTRDIFVPWTDIAIERTRRRFWKVAELRVGKTAYTLTLFDFEANRLARAVPGRWPEVGDFSPDSIVRAARVAFTHWLVGMAFIVGFIWVVPRILYGKWGGGMPIEAVELFAALLGVASLREFFQRTTK